jgi:hypothetical protein
MRNHIGFIALSLLAAAFAGCSSSDKDSTASSSTGGGDLTGELAKYNAAIVPLPSTACEWTADTNSKLGTAVVKLTAGQIGVLSLRSVDSGLLINGNPCTNKDSATTLVTKTALKGITVTGAASNDETIIFDFRNGIFGNNAMTVDLAGGTTDEVAVLSSTGNDKVTCLLSGTADAIDADSDKKADITMTTQAALHFTFDLNDGDDTFDQGACVTKMAVYGGTGKDTIAVGTAKTKGDSFSGGTELASATTAKVDTITFAARTAVGSAINVSLNGTADDGDITTSEVDNILDDFEVVTGTAYNDILTSGTTQASYTLNGGDGNDLLASKVDHGAAFNGGNGIDTVDYHLRAAGVTVTMDGAKADDGYVSDSKYVLDNVAKDVEYLLGTDYIDKITGNSLANVITPGAGADIVFGGDGDDRLVSGYVNDGTTNDKLDGNDVFSGGNGADTIDYSNRVAAGTKGISVTLDAVIASDGTVTSGTASGVIATEADKIGVDVENIWGTIGDDILVGTNDVNVLYGLGGKDKVTAKAGNDQVDLNEYDDDASTPNPCNPVLLTCLDVAAVGCTCGSATLAPTCDETYAANVDCGSDPMDILSCDSGVAAYSTCWKVQK